MAFDLHVRTALFVSIFIALTFVMYGFICWTCLRLVIVVGPCYRTVIVSTIHSSVMEHPGRQSPLTIHSVRQAATASERPDFDDSQNCPFKDDHLHRLGRLLD